MEFADGRVDEPKMSHLHPDHEAEQAHIDRAYECLERSKTDAWRIRDLNEASMGGTFQARYERNAFDEQLLARLTSWISGCCPRVRPDRPRG